MGLFRAEAAGPAEDGCLPGLCLHGRRGFLKSFGAAALAAPSLALAQQPAPAPRRIDVHHHVYPTRWFAAKRDLILGSSDNPPTIMTQWTPQRAVEQMDKHGISTSIACLGNPGVWFGDVQEARALMRMCNEYMAQLGQDFPGRFGAFAALALPDVEGCLNEIAYAFDTLKMDGVHLLTSYDDRWPGDPSFDPVFAELNRRKAVVFIHPTAPNCCGSLNTGAPPSILELPFDEARAVASLVFNGTVSKYPGIKFIFSHAGGPAPVLATRMDQLMRNPRIAERVPEGVPATLKKLYFEVANSTVNPSSMAALLALSAPSQVLFGSDYPYVQMEKTVSGLDRLGYGQDLLGAINRESALKLFPRFA